MKKQVLFLSAVVLAGALSAQVTITTADQPAVGDVYTRARDTTMTQSPGNSGSSQTYAFGALLNQSVDSVTFTLPQWTPFGASYPNSNISVMVNQGDAYIFGDMTPTQFSVQGQAADPFGSGAIPLTFSNPETQMLYPAAYGGSFADTAYGLNQFYFGIDPGIGFVIDSVRVHSWIYKDSEYDGWGSCETPLDTFNVLRQNTYRKQIDTVDIYAFGSWAPAFITQVDSTRTYQYWANGIGFPVVELTDQDDLGQISNAIWLVILPTLTGIPAAEHSTGIPAYPNPSFDVWTFDTPAAEGTLEITDMTGRVVRTVNITRSQTHVSVVGLAAGMYSYSVNGQAMGKVQVAR
ncbi:MAG TPA: T9SS type A sorting domain-containing protein [Bacteroidia bacterium]|nr:T9SS type A sorting domain-containing protein [Bacteroidia bacterium]